MPLRRFALRPVGEPTVRDYLLALALVGAALAVRSLLDRIGPGVADYIPLLSAIVLAGVFCGTAPAAVASAVGGLANIIFFIGQDFLAWRNLNSAYLSGALLLLACAAVLWATHLLRRSAAVASAAEARLAEVFRQIPGAAAILEAPMGRLLLRSAQSEVVLGHLQKRVEQSDDLGAYGGVHDDGRPFSADDYPITRALKTGEIVTGERLRYLKPGGQTVDLEVHAGPVRDHSGQIVAAVGMAFDVSDRVASERRLQRSEAEQRAVAQRLRAALDVGEIGLWDFDLVSERLQLDAAIATMLGLPRAAQQFTRAEMQQFSEPGDRARAREVFTRAITKGAEYTDEVCMRSAQGESRWFAVRGAVLEDKKRVIGVTRDVTQRRRREEALQDALRARDLLMQEADHRIKNSLQLVVSLLTLQASRAADPDARHALSQAIAQVHTVADVHLALQHTPDLRSIEIDQMLQEVCHRVGSLNPSVRLKYKTKGGVRLDASRAIPLGLMVCELVTNALRHAFPIGTGGEIALTMNAKEETLTIAVADTGVGLPVELERVGLGTTVVSAMAKQIGATVSTESAPGRGTSVTIILAIS
jgi:PAS domain S-box-containing protein